jgi:spermidine dehydrogenase
MTDKKNDKKNDKRDRELGMSCSITRRDFLNGVALGVGGILAAPHLMASSDSNVFAPEKAPKYYPPALMGMRGKPRRDLYLCAQAARREIFTRRPGPGTNRETYDLVVVGGGISGLAAAHFYRKPAGDSARILILDNHDDFGGHAKRNEFGAGGRFLLSNGGTQSIESPSRYSDVAKGV